MTNRIGRYYGCGLHPVDEFVMEDTPALGRDQPDAQTAEALAELGDLWRDARWKYQKTLGSPLPLDDDFRRSLAIDWRDRALKHEAEAARLALIERSIMFHDEAEPPAEFDPVYVEYAPGRSIYVAPGCVAFYPNEPQLIAEAKP